MELIKLSDKELRDNAVFDGTELLTVNLHYPSFDGGKSDICKKLSDFYGGAAREYHNYVKNKHIPRLIKSGGIHKKCGASMSWHVSFLSQNMLSILTDASFFDGAQKTTRRLVHNWKLSDCTPFRAREVFAVTRGAKKLYTDEICAKISLGEGNFVYLPHAEARAKKLFDFERYYITPKGVAFYYDAEQISAGKSVFPAFVMPFDGVMGLNPGIVGH